MLNIHAESVAELVRTVENGRKFCIVGHTSPDGDAVGACVAMREFLRSLGKEAVIVLPNRFPAFLRHLDPEGTILLYDADKERAGRAISGSQVLFCLDFNSFSRTDEMADALEASKARKILIDHHIGPDVRSFDLTLSMTDISSTCELLYHILKMFPNVGGNASLLPPLTAEALFTGMTTDTNNFANSVYPSTFSMASELLAAGMDRTAMLCRLYNQFSEGRLRLIGELLRNRMKIVDGKFSYMMLPLGLQHEYGYSKGDVEGVVNRPLEIKDVLISVLFTEDKDFVRVSIRSKPDVDVNAFARKYFNGGGHKNAAGGRLEMDMGMIPEYFAASVREYAMQAHLL